MIPDIRECKMPPEFFRGNRSKLLDSLPERCFVVMFAGKSVPMSADSHYRFWADRNFFYLSGIDQEDSVLVIRKNGSSVTSALFIHPCDPMRERWTGKRLSTTEAAERSGAEEILFLPSAPDYLMNIVGETSFSIATDSGIRPGPGTDFVKMAGKIRGEENLIQVAPLLINLRMVKAECEIDMIRKAIEVTDLAIRDAMSILRPGVSELQLLAAMEHGMARKGCLLPAFQTIVASGENAFCLHHASPEGREISRGQLIQVDVGASAGGLCADISRVYPVGGAFSEKQKAVYDAVRLCQQEAFRVIKPGATLAGINQAVRSVAQVHLEKLGLLKPGEENDLNEYVWHNAAHHLGMDVHDVCHRDVPLTENCVLAVEPGLYIRSWGIGFRIEDDVLVTRDGCEILSDFISRERDEIEQQIVSAGGK